MAKIFSHKDWMKFTYGGLSSRRSIKLKVIDAALLAYDMQQSPANKSAISDALTVWKISKGAGWKTSVRNKKNAIENLEKQLIDQPGRSGEMVALSHIRDESRAIITDLFQHKQLVYRPGIWTILAGNGFVSRLGLKYQVNSVRNKASVLINSGGAPKANAVDVNGQAATAAQAFWDQIVPADLRIDVLAFLAPSMPMFMKELTESCTPFVGIASSGASTLVAMGKVAKAKYKLSEGTTHLDRTLATDEPYEAFQALVKMLERESNQNIENFLVGLVELGSKGVSMLVDGGTATNAAIGLASGLVKLLMIARIAVRDVQERNAANKIMLEPIITSELFKACPVMGAYMICCVPTSVLVNSMLTSEHFYEVGMMDRVERAVKKHINPLKFEARRLVKSHRMYIPSLQHAPNILEKNKEKLKKMKQPSTEVWADRIEGFGSGKA
jgi:hypothetical protein